MDEAHSMLSREKGLAGMAENVRRGHRAGGRAPIGYRLERQATGAMRDGAAVTKSKLAPSDHAPAIAAYLKARAAGEARAGALELQASSSSSRP
jgi:site-specific DNA recombinase